MAANRRGFSRERHTRLKVAVTTLALAAFAASWVQLSANHAPIRAGAEAPPLLDEATATVAAPATPTTPVATSTPAGAKPTPTRKPRTSRGS
jgi:hypothetical protein